MGNEIDPVQFGKLISSVETLKEDVKELSGQVHAMNSQMVYKVKYPNGQKNIHRPPGIACPVRMVEVEKTPPTTEA